MSLSANDVKKIAYLARLGIDEGDIEAYTNDLTNMLNLMEKMGECDTSAVVPMAHPLEQTQRLRPDVVTEQDQHAYFQTIAPQVEAGLYLVPKVIE